MTHLFEIREFESTEISDKAKEVEELLENMQPRQENTQALYSVAYRLPYHLRTIVNGRKIAIGALLVLGETGWNYFSERFAGQISCPASK